MQMITKNFLKPNLTLRSQNGFTAVSALLYLMLIISFAYATLALSWMLIKKQQTQKICQNHLLDAQEHLINGQEQLLSLNPQAISLILRKKQLEDMIRIAPTAQERIALKAALAIVMLQMSILRRKQQSIFLLSETKALNKIWTLRREINNLFKQHAHSWKTSLPNPTWSSSRPKIMLRKIQKDPLLPIYKIPPDYAHQQTLSSHFKINIKNLFPNWIRLLKPNNSYWQEHCQSHPEKGDLKWYAQIGEGRLFGSAYSFH